MIEFALTQCDWLTVLVCGIDQENIQTNTRVGWITKTFEQFKNIEVLPFDYLESELPNTSESSEEASKVWANIFTKFFPDYTLLITSEPYGDFVAGFMGIRHIAFDIPRKLFPISASQVRNDIFANWACLPDIVKQSLAVKVALLGTESTGKTTLSHSLAAHFDGGLVAEAARDVVADSRELRFDDLQAIAAEHAFRISNASKGEKPLLFLDTDIHITKSYARYVFNKELVVSDEIYQCNKANLYLYLNAEVPYLQDGTRLKQQDRDLLDASHREVLKHHQIKIVELTGSWQKRYGQAVLEVEKLVKRLTNQPINQSTIP